MPYIVYLFGVAVETVYVVPFCLICQSVHFKFYRSQIIKKHAGMTWYSRGNLLTSKRLKHRLY